MSSLMLIISESAKSFRWIYWSIFFLLMFIVVSIPQGYLYWLAPYYKFIPEIVLQAVSFLNDLTEHFLLLFGLTLIVFSLFIQYIHERYREKNYSSLKIEPYNKPTFTYYLAGFYYLGLKFCLLSTLFTLVFEVFYPGSIYSSLIKQPSLLLFLYSFIKITTVVICLIHVIYTVLIKFQQYEYEQAHH